MENIGFIQRIQRYRRDLHQIPELGFDLYKTHAYIKNILLELGYNPITVAKTGLLVHIKGVSPESIAFRADMDGLSITEQNNIPYKSLHNGVMHACGHDGHMAMLLGLADYLVDQPTPNQSIVLLFQPAEEGPGGAEVVVDSGILSQYGVTQIYGIHLYPNLLAGKVGLTDGLMMSEISEYDVMVQGVGAHGAEPEKGIDAIEASIALIQAFKQIIKTNVSDPKKAILNIGTLSAGETRNSVAETACFTGTVRTLNQDDYQVITSEMVRASKQIEQAYQVTVTLDIKNYYPPVVNDHSLYETMKNSLQADIFEHIKPLMVSEDFAFYQERFPGLFMLLGTNDDVVEHSHPLHSAHFNFNDHLLIEGVNIYLHILFTYDILNDRTCLITQNSNKQAQALYLKQ